MRDIVIGSACLALVAAIYASRALGGFTNATSTSNGNN